MNEHQRLTDLFLRFFEKSCTPQEKEELLQLLLSNSQDNTLRRLIAETWSLDHPVYEQDQASAEAILRQILALQSKQATPSAQSGSHSIFRWTRIAAVFLGLALLSFCWIYFHHRSLPVIVASSSPSPSIPHSADTCITLSDGSKVMLHNKASIDAPAVFGASREVRLTGEAYFDIRHDARPFIVHTGSVRTIVLGTAFNINAGDPKHIIITVTKGRIKVINTSGQARILSRNQQLSVDSLHSSPAIAVNAAEVLVWKKPYLLFNDITIKEAMDELAQRYHVTISFANPAAENCRVTASFTGGESFVDMLTILSKINNMEYRIDHQQVTIIGEGCK